MNATNWRRDALRCGVLGLLACAVLPLAAAQQYEIDWWTVDSGGGASSGGYFDVAGTVGQHDAGTTIMTGGGFELTGGFWGVTTTGEPQYEVGDLNCDGWVNNGDIDAFVYALSYPEQYPDEYPDCDIMLGDINGDGWMNNGDIDAFITLLNEQ